MRQQVITLSQAVDLIIEQYGFPIIGREKTLQNAARRGDMIAEKRGKVWYVHPFHLKMYCISKGVRYEP